MTEIEVTRANLNHFCSKLFGHEKKKYIENNGKGAHQNCHELPVPQTKEKNINGQQHLSKKQQQENLLWRCSRAFQQGLSDETKTLFLKVKILN